MAPFSERLHAALTGLGVAASDYAVAYSGGVDSTLLLTVLCEIAGAKRLRALHVDHGLHPDSTHWAAACAAYAAALGVGYASRRLSWPAGDRRNTEARAREARYAAFAEWLRPGEVLLTAHHADDQLETVLLRLMRGAGVRGLRGVVPAMPFAAGRLARPLLAFTRQEIETEAAVRGLRWTEDPSNRDTRLDRNHLRARVLPALRERWPDAARHVGTSAARMDEAEGLLVALAALDAPVPLHGSEPLPQGAWLSLPPARQRNLLRHLLRARGLPLPNATQLEELLTRLHVTRPDARTRVAWPGAEARLFRQRLYLLPTLPAWNARAEFGLLPGRPWQGVPGRLELTPATDAAGLPDSWVQGGLRVRFRRGGERLRGAGQRPSEALKHWFQRVGIVPWMRDRTPLLYHGDELVAVADLWQREAQDASTRRWRLVWTEHPPLF